MTRQLNEAEVRLLAVYLAGRYYGQNLGNPREYHETTARAILEAVAEPEPEREREELSS